MFALAIDGVIITNVSGQWPGSANGILQYAVVLTIFRKSIVSRRNTCGFNRQRR